MLSMEEIDKKVQDYRERNHVKFHNTYYMYTEDRDGNITSEAYGTNLMTDYGFTKLCTEASGTYNTINYWNVSNFPFHIGTGTTPPTFSDTALEAYVATVTDHVREWIVVSTDYDPDTHVLYNVSRVGYGYFDYNIPGYTDISISEVGVGKTQNALYFRFLVRDEHGVIQPIIKHANEKLYLYMYYTSCVHEDFMLDPLARNEYTLINPSAKADALGGLSSHTNQNNYIGGYLNDRLYNWRDRNWTINERQSYGCYLNQSSSGLSPYLYQNITNNSISTDHTIEFKLNSNGELLVEDPDVYLGYCLSSTEVSTAYTADVDVDFFIMTCDKQESDEEIVSYDMYTNSITDPRLNNEYGYGKNNTYKQGTLSVVDYNITSMKMFNVQDNDWTINESFYQNANFQSFNKFATRLHVFNFLCPDDVRRTVYWFVNPWTSMKIKSFSNTGIRLFAADKAWDTSTWTEILDLTNVPDALSNKRYYVCYSNVTLFYELQYDYYPRITYATETKSLGSAWSSNGYVDGRIVGTDANNWFAIGNSVFIMNNDNSLKQTYSINSDVSIALYFRYAYDNVYLYANGTANNWSQFYAVMVQQDAAPVRYKLPLLFDKTMNVYPMITGADESYVVINSPDINDGCAIINMALIDPTYTEHDVDDLDMPNCFINGRILADGSMEANTENWWLHLDTPIELPTIIDPNSEEINVTFSGTNSTGYGYLWGELVYYDEDDNIIGVSTYYASNTGFTQKIPSGVVKININVHASVQYNYTQYQLGPSSVTSFNVKIDHTDIGTDTITYIPDAARIIPIKGSGYIVYTKQEDYMYRWYVADISDPETIISTFDIESSQIVPEFITGYGFAHYVYIRTRNASNVYSTRMYNINTGALTTLEFDVDLPWGGESQAYYNMCGNDKCIIFANSANEYKLISADEPETLQHLTSNIANISGSFNNANKHMYIQLKYINNGKQLVMAVHGNGEIPYQSTLRFAINLLDIGVFLKDKGWLYDTPHERFAVSPTGIGRNTINRTFVYPYKQGVISLPQHLTTYNDWTLYYYPIEGWVPHKTVGTTRTITAYNNPFSISGKEFRITRTNDMTQLGLTND